MSEHRKTCISKVEAGKKEKKYLSRAKTKDYFNLKRIAVDFVEGILVAKAIGLGNKGI